jgi:hypothetical protein
MAYFTLRNVLTIGGVFLAVGIWLAMMIAAADSSAPEDKESAWSKAKPILNIVVFVWAALIFLLIACASLYSAIISIQAYEPLAFFESALRFLLSSVVTVLLLFRNKKWVRELLSGQSLLSKVIYGLFSVGFMGSLVLKVLAALAK